MKIKRYYLQRDIKVAQLEAVCDVLRSAFTWDVRPSYTLFYPSQDLEIDGTKAMKEVLESHGEPQGFRAVLKTASGRSCVELDSTSTDRFTARCYAGDHKAEGVLDRVEGALSLEPADLCSADRNIQSAFIAHGFDQQSEQYVHELARFLTLIRIVPYSGRAFATNSVSAKVRAELERRDIVFAVVTPKDDCTWLIQEMAATHALKKPLFVLKHADADFKPGIHGDFEYIQFEHISKSFIPILEGLRGIRGLDTPLSGPID